MDKKEDTKGKLSEEKKQGNLEGLGNDPGNPVRLYSDGVFDLFHFGHARLLENCKKMFKYTTLVVGVTSDAETQNEKGRPVMTEHERAETLKHCRWVDEVVYPCPWIPSVVRPSPTFRPSSRPTTSTSFVTTLSPTPVATFPMSMPRSSRPYLLPLSPCRTCS